MAREGLSMTCEQTEYYRRREAQERAAAKWAGSLSARRVHQQMAENYSALVHGTHLSDPLYLLRACGAL